MKHSEDDISLYYIGIDPGKNTGIAIWNSSNKSFIKLDTVLIHEAFDIVMGIKKGNIKIIFEDARLRTWYGNATKERLQGVGSIKRDCTIWEDFLLAKSIPYSKQKPKSGMTKWDADYFKKITGWTERTSEHSRDAAILVYGL